MQLVFPKRSERIWRSIDILSAFTGHGLNDDERQRQGRVPLPHGYFLSPPSQKEHWDVDFHEARLAKSDVLHAQLSITRPW